MPSNENAIRVENLTKKYGDLVAVNSISFKVRKGEVFAFLGPNGAGKTTTVEILECIRKPTSGEAYVLGYDIRKESKEIKRVIGILPQEFEAFDRLTVRENLEYFAGIYGVEQDVDSLIRMVGLEDKKDTLYKNLSSGLKKRLGVAIALVNNPEIVFLDEPTSGLDPQARRAVWKVIRDLKRKGKTVFLTTHYMNEAEALADTVTIIHKGEIVAQGTPEELIEKFGRRSLLIIRKCDERAVEVLKEKGFETEFNVTNGSLEIPLSSHRSLREILDTLTRSRIRFGEIHIKSSSLEDVFLNLIGAKISEEGELV